jgi:ADP-heptose:LPS heptosyltransferase
MTADFAMRTMIADFLEFLATTALLIWSDTGVAHIADAVGGPDVALLWRREPADPTHDRDRHAITGGGRG